MSWPSTNRQRRNLVFAIAVVIGFALGGVIARSAIVEGFWLSTVVGLAVGGALALLAEAAQRAWNRRVARSNSGGGS